jgi:hypothetical protein
VSGAREYLRELQVKLQDNGQEIPAPLLKHRFELKDYEEAYRSLAPGALTIEGRQEWLNDNLVRPFLSNIASADARLLLDVPVGLLPIYEPNAWAVQTPGGEDLIVLHTELASVLSFYNELNAACFSLLSQNPQSSYELHDHGFKYIYEAFRRPRTFWFPIIPVKLTLQQFGVVQMMTLGNELFILAHEFAHIALGHTGECVTVQLGMAKKTSIRKLHWEQQQELDADLKAVEWLCSLRGKVMGPFFGLVNQIPILCAEVLVLIHFVESHLGFPDITATHPPASERLKFIASKAKNFLSNLEREELSRWIATTEAVRTS